MTTLDAHPAPRRVASAQVLGDLVDGFSPIGTTAFAHATLDATTPVADAHRFMRRRCVSAVTVVDGDGGGARVTLGEVAAACSPSDIAEDVATRRSHD